MERRLSRRSSQRLGTDWSSALADKSVNLWSNHQMRDPSSRTQQPSGLFVLSPSCHADPEDLQSTVLDWPDASGGPQSNPQPFAMLKANDHEPFWPMPWAHFLCFFLTAAEANYRRSREAGACEVQEVQQGQEPGEKDWSSLEPTSSRQFDSCGSDNTFIHHIMAAASPLTINLSMEKPDCSQLFCFSRHGWQEMIMELAG